MAARKRILVKMIRAVHLLARAMLAIAMEAVGPLGAAAGHLARAMAKVEVKKRRQTKNILLHRVVNILVLVVQLGASGGVVVGALRMLMGDPSINCRVDPTISCKPTGEPRG